MRQRRNPLSLPGRGQGEGKALERQKRHRIRPPQTKNARRLRHDSTVPERLLWGNLRGRHFGDFKFRRQFAVDRYIADFCCPEVKLIIELDGHSHDTTAIYDLDRESALKTIGFTVIRFTNDEVLKNIASVLACIENALIALSNSSVQPSPRPYPCEGEGERRENEAMETSK